MTNHTDAVPEFKLKDTRAIDGAVGPRSEDESSFIIFLASSLFLYIHLLGSPPFSRHIQVPTVSNVVHRIPSPTDSHDCLRSCLRSSTWTRIHPPTSSLYISLFIFTASVIRHPFFRPPHLALNINVQLVTSTRTRR